MKGLFCTSVLVGDDSSLAALAAVLSSAGVEPTRCVEPLAYLSGSAAHPFASPLPGAMDVRIVIADLPSVNSAGFTQVDVGTAALVRAAAASCDCGVVVLTSPSDVVAATAAITAAGSLTGAFTRAERLRLAASALASLASYDRTLARRLVVEASAVHAETGAPIVGAISGKRAPVLIIGGGGREAALAWKIAKSPRVSQVFVLPGNGGSALAPTMSSAAVVNIDGVDACNGVDVVAKARAEGFALVIVGPEAPLVAGVSDALRAAEIPVFGPSKAAAEIEASKAFSKGLMEKHGVRTARYKTFDAPAGFDDALAYARACSYPVVLKASGLAAGKGVLLPNGDAELEAGLRDLMLDERFGEAGATTLVEERLEGEEVSYLAFCDGANVIAMPPAQDHKRVGDGDAGPNTGGMGAYAPAPALTPALGVVAERESLQKISDAMAALGTPFTGVLYAGLMLTPLPERVVSTGWNGIASGEGGAYTLTEQAKGSVKADGSPGFAFDKSGDVHCGLEPAVLEYNCRFGDPETQAILPLLESDLFELVWACAVAPANWADSTAVAIKVGGAAAPLGLASLPSTPSWACDGDATAGAVVVVAASEGYPLSYPKGRSITGLDDAVASAAPTASVNVFHAGTRASSDGAGVETSGGRVLGVSCVDSQSMSAAISGAYTALSSVKFEGMHHRSDIAHRATAVRIGVLGSTRGSDLQHIIDAIESPDGALKGKARVSLVLSNRYKSGILHRAANHGIPSAFVSRKQCGNDEAYYAAMSDLLLGAGVDLVLCIGYMHIIPASFCRTWSGRLLNAHPSLLPSFKGLMDLEVYAQVLAARDADASDARLILPATATQVDGAAGAPVTGCTIHFVTDDVDSGPIVVQLATALTAADTDATVVTDLKPRVQKMEGDAFISAILKFKAGELAALAPPSTLPKYRGLVDPETGLMAPSSPGAQNGGAVSFGDGVTFGARPKIMRRQTGPASAPRAISMTSAANSGAPPRKGSMSMVSVTKGEKGLLPKSDLRPLTSDSDKSVEGSTTARGISFAAGVSFAPPARIERTLTGYGDDLVADVAPAMLTYASAGVSIEAGNELVDMIKPLCKSTRRSGADGDIGGFGGVFDLAAAGYGGLANSAGATADDDTVLVSGTDGVGTKLLLAIDCEKFDTVGIDLVAMCVNDVIVQGAEPLYFLDYAATGKLEPAAMTAIVSGVAKGCIDSNCALIGGETAEMPQMYADGHFDLAGFSVGAVKRGAILPRLEEVQAGDVIIGCASSGVHSNGFSMVRKIVSEGGFAFDDAAPFAAVGGDGSESLVEALLVPTRLYVLSVLNAIKAGDALDAAAEVAVAAPGAPAQVGMRAQTYDGPREGGHAIRALCHITGGGLPENMPRILPSSFACELDVNAWIPMLPPVFKWLAAEAEKLSGGEGVCDRAALQHELLRTFNCGIGFVVIVRPDAVGAITAALEAKGEKCAVIGTITPRESAEASQVIVNGSIFNA